MIRGHDHEGVTAKLMLKTTGTRCQEETTPRPSRGWIKCIPHPHQFFGLPYALLCGQATGDHHRATVGSCVFSGKVISNKAYGINICAQIGKLPHIWSDIHLVDGRKGEQYQEI